MNLRALETLAVISRVGSFTAAAEACNMTLSAVSMQMKSLEAELDVALFDRTVRSPRLTPLGRLVAARAEDVLTREAELRSLCRPGQALAGSYRIGMIQSAGVRLVPAALQNARRTAPRARLEFVSGLSEGLSADVLSGAMDAAVVSRVGPDDARLFYTPLVHDPMAIAIPAGSGVADLETAMTSLCFLHFNPRSGIGKAIAMALHRLSLVPQDVMYLDSIEATMECVRKQVGFTVLPEPDIARYARADVSVFPMKALGERELALVTRNDMRAELWRSRLADLFASAVRAA